MSASTLYREFPSKEDLTMACVERWAHELGVGRSVGRRREGRDGFERFLQLGRGLGRHQRRAIAGVHPRSAQRLSGGVEALQRSRSMRVASAAGRRCAALLKPELDERLAFVTLRAVMDHFLRPDSADRLEIPRREAIRQAVAIWAGGALKRSPNTRSRRCSGAGASAALELRLALFEERLHAFAHVLRRDSRSSPTARRRPATAPA